MQDPSEKEPFASMRYSLSPLDVSGITVTASLFAHACMHVESHKYQEEDYVAPPDNGIAQQVYSLVVPREKLSLETKTRIL